MKKYPVPRYEVNKQVIDILNDKSIPWFRRFHQVYCYGKSEMCFDENGKLIRDTVWRFKKGVEAYDIDVFIQSVIAELTEKDGTIISKSLND